MKPAVPVTAVCCLAGAPPPEPEPPVCIGEYDGVALRAKVLHEHPTRPGAYPDIECYPHQRPAWDKNGVVSCLW